MSSLLAESLVNFVQIYSLLILVYCLLTWFRGAEWSEQIMSFLAPITEPYLGLFRSFIPPLGGLDLSPMFALIVLQLVTDIL